MNRQIKIAALLLSAAIIPVAVPSCAIDKDESTESRQRRVLEAYIYNYNKEHGTNLQPTESGIYVLEHNQQPGGQIISGESYVYVHYETQQLDGTYTYTTNKETAQRLGTYSASKYYGPTLMRLGNGSLTEGVEEVLKMTTQGSYIDAIIPPWLSGSKYDSYYGTTQQETESIRYMMNIRRVISDITQYQLDTMRIYMNKNYNMQEKDTLYTGMYFKKLVDAGQDTIVADTEVKYRYIGKLLDGYVFDTNIADSAKKFRIYDSSKSYDAATITYKSTYDEMTSSSSDESSSGVIKGFAMALKEMSYGDVAIAVFYSDLGYGASGNMSSGAGVPAYQPIVFYIAIEEEDE